jgi:hypothetical protein
MRPTTHVSLVSCLLLSDARQLWRLHGALIITLVMLDLILQ